jgi:hypothetical protein
MNDDFMIQVQLFYLPEFRWIMVSDSDNLLDANGAFLRTIGIRSQVGHSMPFFDKPLLFPNQAD